MPELRKFLKMGDAESYENVTIEWIHGKKAKMAIYHNGIFVEEVYLSSLKTRQDMNNLMMDKGFRRLPDDVVAGIKKRRKEEADRAYKEELKEEKRRQDILRRRAGPANGRRYKRNEVHALRGGVGIGADVADREQQLREQEAQHNQQ